jgi:hypothetical protein
MIYLGSRVSWKKRGNRKEEGMGSEGEEEILMWN